MKLNLRETKHIRNSTGIGAQHPGGVLSIGFYRIRVYLMYGDYIAGDDPPRRGPGRRSKKRLAYDELKEENLRKQAYIESRYGFKLFGGGCTRGVDLYRLEREFHPRNSLEPPPTGNVFTRTLLLVPGTEALVFNLLYLCVMEQAIDDNIDMYVCGPIRQTLSVAAKYLNVFALGIIRRELDVNHALNWDIDTSEAFANHTQRIRGRRPSCHRYCNQRRGDMT